MKFNRFLTALLVTVLVFIAFMTMLTISTMDKLREDQEWVTHSKLVQQEVQNITASAYVMENAVRGYILTREQRTRIDFNSGLHRYNEAMKDLGMLVSDNALQKSQMRKIKVLVSRRVNEVEAHVFLEEEEDTTIFTKNTVSFIESGQETLRDLRLLSEIMKVEEDQLYIRRKAAFDHSVSQSIGIIILLITIICFIIIFAFGIIRNQLRENRRNTLEMETALKNLLRSEEKFRKLNDATSDIICKINLNEEIVSWNAAGEKVLGYPASEIQGSDIRILFEKEADFEAVLDIIDSDTIMDLNIRHRNGKLIPMEIIAFDWVIADEKFIGITFRDNTQRHEQNRIISELGTRFDLVLKSAKYGVWDWPDMSTGEQWWSDTMYSLFGYDRSELESTQPNFRKILHPDYRDLTQQTVEQNLKTGKEFTLEYPVRTKNRGYKWFRVVGDHVSDVHGNVTRMMGVISDITEEKEQQLRIEELNKRFDLTMKSAEYGIWDWFDTDEDNIWFSDTFVNLLGYRQGEFDHTMTQFKDVVHPDDYDSIFTSVKQNLEGNGIYKCEYRVQTKNQGYQWFRAVGDHLYDENTGKRRMIGIFYNISEEIRQRNMLEDSNKQLEQFAYVASHDLQEPLRKIQAFGDRLKMLYKNNEDMPGLDYVNRMQNGAYRMQNLIQDLLSFSRVSTSAGERSDVDLDELLTEIRSELEVLIDRKKAKIIVEKLPAIRSGLRSQLFQLFQNLISNAIKFTEEDTIPEVHIRSERKKGGELSELFPDLNVKQDYELISVADNGIGFDETYRDRIFTIFQRLHSKTAYEGTGIGLAICKRIVENHEGFITATSEEGKGATFYVVFPANDNA